jgi:DNA-binding SARP family transcriptional activator
MDMKRVDINTEVEAYPVLVINEWAEYSNPARQIEIPAEMMARLIEAECAVDQAQEEIMRYVAERYDYSDVREWLAERDDSA